MRLFVAVWPDATTNGRLALMRLRSDPHLRPVADGQWHVTLRFLGEVEADLVPPLGRALAGVATACAKAVRCEIGPSTAWLDRAQVLQLPASGLDVLAVMVRDATVGLLPPLRADELPFVGHVTLGRSRRGRIEPSTRSALQGVPFVAAWTVSSIDLVASEQTPKGVLYTTQERFVLGEFPD